MIGVIGFHSDVLHIHTKDDTNADMKNELKIKKNSISAIA